MELQIYKNEDDYNEAVRNNANIDYYVTTLNGYEYIMHRGNPFRYINGLGEKRSINPMDIARVIRTRDCITIILDLDTIVSNNLTWNEILHS